MAARGELVCDRDLDARIAVQALIGSGTLAGPAAEDRKPPSCRRAPGWAGTRRGTCAAVREHHRPRLRAQPGHRGDPLDAATGCGGLLGLAHHLAGHDSHHCQGRSVADLRPCRCQSVAHLSPIRARCSLSRTRACPLPGQHRCATNHSAASCLAKAWESQGTVGTIPASGETRRYAAHSTAYTDRGDLICRESGELRLCGQPCCPNLP